MCELFGLCSRRPSTISFSLERLSRHGGVVGPHRDGWGVGLYEGPDLNLIREPNAAAESALIRFIERHSPPSTLVLSHIRKASRGALALRNTQPFCRELGGRMHGFAHNGDLPGVETDARFTPRHHRPVGETDSEYAFCALLARLEPLWGQASPALNDRIRVIAEFAAQLRELGPANFLYADGEYLFAHSDRRYQADHSVRPPGLHRLIRAGAEGTLSGGGVKVGGAPQEVVLLASVPLTDELWEPLGRGALVATTAGREVARLAT